MPKQYVKKLWTASDERALAQETADRYFRSAISKAVNHEDMDTVIADLEICLKQTEYIGRLKEEEDRHARDSVCVSDWQINQQTLQCTCCWKSVIRLGKPDRKTLAQYAKKYKFCPFCGSKTKTPDIS